MNALKIMEGLLRDFFKPHCPPSGTGLNFRNHGRNRRSPESIWDQVSAGLTPVHPSEPIRATSQVIDFAKAHEIAHG